MNYRTTIYECNNRSFKKRLNDVFAKNDLICMFDKLGISTNIKETIKEVSELRVEFYYYSYNDNHLHTPFPLFIALEELYESGKLEDFDDLYEYIRVSIYLQLEDNVTYTLSSIVLKVEEKED